MNVHHSISRIPAIPSLHVSEFLRNQYFRKIVPAILYRFLEEKEIARGSSYNLLNCGLAEELNASHFTMTSMPDEVAIAEYGEVASTKVPFLSIAVVAKLGSLYDDPMSGTYHSIETGAFVLCHGPALRGSGIKANLHKCHALHWSGWQPGAESTVFNIKRFLESSLSQLVSLTSTTQVSVPPANNPLHQVQED